MNKKYKLLSLVFLTAFLLFAFDSFGPRTDNGPASANDFVNFETPHIHPIDITPDQQKLLAVNTADNRLEVFQITGGGLTHLGSIPVGMDPVTVRVRSNSEAWVVNHISDNISIVDLNLNVVTKIIRTDNEPCDVVFAGSPQKAFVSCSEANTVNVFTLSNLNATPQKIRIIGEEPRAMAVSPDGNNVYVAFFESGNQTTIVPGGKGEGFQGGRAEDAVRHPSGPYGGVDVPPNDGNNFSPPINPALAPPPPVSIIVRKNASNQWLDDNNGDWTPFISGNLASESHRIQGWDLPDRDVAIMNANNLSTTYQTSLMNIQMAMAVNPNSGQLSVVGSDAINEIRFESNVNGIFTRMNWAGFTPGGSKIIKDMNSHLTYNTHSIPQSERNKSISDPRGIQWNSSGTKAYVTGMGSNNVIVLNVNGNRLFSQPINVGQGPTGIVLHESSNRAFVLNKFDASISILNINSESEMAQIPFYDPTPEVIKNGRPHLYSSHENSGLGHLACASCHIDSRTDGLAWDLGNPDGNMTFAEPGTPVDGAPFNGFHPMKGPLRTSPLTDIVRYPSMHWRGDRKDIFDFDAAFVSLQGADAPKVLGEMQQLEGFLSTIHFPPNPYRNLDNSIANSVPIFGPNNTIASFVNPQAAIAEFQTACLPCHPGNRGRSDILVENFLHEGTHLVPETFRGFYERSGFWSNTTTGNTSGFGKLPDASEFFNLGQLNISTQRNNEFTALLMSFDGGVPWANEGDLPSLDAHAAVGQQIVINGGISSQDDQLLNQFLAMAASNAVGLIVKGIYEGEYRGFSFIGNQNYQSDKASQIVSHTDLMSDALNNGPITFTIVPNNTSTRMGIDRDSDGIFDWDEDNNNATSPTVNAITITSDDAYELYFNGILIGTGDTWQTAEHYQNLALATGENVVAIKGIDQGDAAALIAELRLAGQRTGTNTQWKVNTQLVNNWNQIGFDDNAWSNATDYGGFGNNGYGQEVKDMPFDTPARWIWSNDNNNHNTVYLRFKFNANQNQSLEACQGEVVLYDDFSSGLTNWTNTNNASVNNDVLTLSQNKLMRSSTGDTWADYTLSAELNIQSSGAGLVFRHIDNNNFYIWKLNANGDLQTSKQQNALFSTLKNIPLGLQTNTNYNISITVEGNSIRTYINHQLVDITVDNSFAQGRVGFHQNAGQTASFDNVQVCLLTEIQQDNCNWTEVANENNNFTISGTDLVRYGANGVYFYRTLSGTVDCANSTFGDPIPGVTKNCWLCQTTGMQNQTISFNAISNKLNTDAPFAISATASSGLPVAFQVLSGPATISGNTVTLTGQVGTVSIQATQAGNANFNPAPPVTRSFEVQIDNPSTCNTTMNLALNKTTTQSSTVFGAVASRANDGNTDGNFLNNSVSATDSELNAWWEVDLGEVSNIEDIEVWNRTDNRPDRLSDFYVLVSDVPFSSNNLNTTLNQSGVSNYYTANNAGTPTNLTINRTGRYLRVQLNYAEHLTIAEIKIIGCTDVNCPVAGTPCDDNNPNTENDIEDGNCNCAGTPINSGECMSTTNVALNKITTQSSTVFGAVASRANDGNTDGAFLNNSVSATDSELNAWWELDLGEVYNIEEIEVWNRTDNRADRLSNYYVFISDNSFNSNNLNTILNQTGVDNYYQSNQAASPTTITANRTGRYVRVQLNYAEHLTIAEIKVIGCAMTNCPAAGTPCDDNNPNTENDIEDGNCNCAGTPIGQTFVTVTCPNNITVDAPTGQTSAVVNWNTATTTFSCPTGNVTLTQTAGLPSGSVFSIGTHTISYQATNECSDTDNCSFTVTVNELTNPGNYCTADSDFPWQDWITNVSLGTINNNSGKSAYGDFTNLSTNLSNGTNYTLSVSNSFSYLQNYSVYSRAWIDYNQDKQFSASELVLSVDKTNLANGTILDIVSESFIVPNTASTGTTRMRVILSKDTPPTSCGTIAFGEVEDYNINITANAAARAVYFLNGEKKNRRAILNWVTNEEFTNDYFIIERSADQISFEEITTINSREEFTRQTRSYNYIDEAPLAGANYYRIKKIAMDGSFEYSNVKLLNFGEKRFLRVYPNPAANESFIDLSNYLDEQVELSIYNVGGIKQSDYIVEKATEVPFEMDLRNFQNGAYLIYIKVEGHRAQVRKLIVNRMY